MRYRESISWADQHFVWQGLQDHIAKSAEGDAAVTKLLSKESSANGVHAAHSGALNGPYGQVQGFFQLSEMVSSGSGSSVPLSEGAARERCRLHLSENGNTGRI